MEDGAPSARPSPYNSCVRTDKRWGLERWAMVCVAALGVWMCADAGSAAAWWRLPLWGAEVRAFAIDPFAPATVYCGTSRGNFYGSRDGGATWEPLLSGPAFPGYYVSALIADPGVPGRLWASLAGELGGGLVVRSDDHGATWTPLLKSTKTVMTRA